MNEICLRSSSRGLMISFMKGYLILGLRVLAFCMVIMGTGCAENSGWGAAFGGAQLQQDGPPSVAPSEAPPGSGSVEYIPQGNF
jgi:hypothetical protein